MAMGGVFAALAVVIMNLGGLIPVATYTTPVLCMLLLKFVLLTCGRRIAWAWYAAVAILGLLMSPDKGERRRYLEMKAAVDAEG